MFYVAKLLNSVVDFGEHGISSLPSDIEDDDENGLPT
jgi:hypothetical protein